MFDIKSQQEMQPLKNPSQNVGSRVTSIDICEETSLLVSGMSDGTIALWDLEQYSLLKQQQITVKSPVTVVTHVFSDASFSSIKVIVCEDLGSVILLTFSKRAIFGGYTMEQDVLFKESITGPAAVAVFKPSPHFEHDYCDEYTPIAVGGIDNISIITLNPIVGLHQIKKPRFCRAFCNSYLDWGWGLTPSHRERTVPILAIAWDRLIQLVYVNQEGTSLEIDGFFYSDKEVIGLYFLSDSVLQAIFESKEGRELKILYTPKFYPGSFKQLELAEQASNYE